MWVEYFLLVIAYFLGSIPTGYVVGRIVGIDIRQHGSGSTGATNVWRCVGKPAGITVFAVDFLKGFVAVFLMQSASQLQTWLRPFFSSFFTLNYSVPENWMQWFAIGAALLALLGHSRSIWIGFSGGKSVATGLGVLFAINWIVAATAFGLWLATMAIWRTVSLSSILAAIATPILMLIVRADLAYLVLTAIGGGFVVWRHRSNIERLLQGTEPSIFASSTVNSINNSVSNTDTE
ncbi:glycerol-3-phosphate 1-O-acyltransferase PlsY [Tumidithrix elongata RA019]|uniref:Glycerol-3-phosphate acyltransferase n=1 Tax=Tumidithrix elongata BACA0141 TaxID=2716417 RepID=A0AAW9PQF4_9CYAN|nr:glycerol-3-phosphate 1-O-acyltransferase PlsY [Tumidithrix elongata RA019]